MTRGQATATMLAVALFDVALAVVGLAVGVLRVATPLELVPFGLAVVVALGAMWLAFRRLLGGEIAEEAEDPMTRVFPETPSERRRRLDDRRQRLGRESKTAMWTTWLLLCSLALGAWVAAARSAADVAGGHSAASETVVVERASGSGDLLPIAGLVAVGVALALVAGLLWRLGRGKAVAAGAAAVVSVGSLAAAGTSALGRFSFNPHFDVTLPERRAPVKAGPLLMVRLHTVQPPRLTVRLPERRSFTLLSLGGISLSPHGQRAPCACHRVLPITP